MSDGAAAATGTDTGGQAPGQDAGQANGQANGFDPGQIMQQFQGLQTSQEDLRTMIQGLGDRIPQPEQEQEQALELDLASFLGGEQEFQEQPQFTPEQNQRFNESLNQVVSQAVQQALAPIQQEQQQFRDERAMDMLVNEFPIIGENQEVAKQTFDTANQLAMQLSQGQPWGQALAQNPEFVRGVLLQSIGARALNDAANQSEAGADAGARLENTGGAGPGNVFSGDDAAMQIVNAGNGPGSKVLDF